MPSIAERRRQLERQQKSSDDGAGGWRGFVDDVASNAKTAMTLTTSMATGMPAFGVAGLKSGAGLGRLPGTVGLGVAQGMPGPVGDTAEEILDSPVGRFVADEGAFDRMVARDAGGQSPLANTWQMLGDTAPLVTEIPESFVDTGRRGLELNMALTGIRDDVGLQDTEYGAAWEQGQLPLLAVEDTANLAAVAFGASKGVGAAARAGRAGANGTRSGRIATALSRHADDLGALSDSVGNAAVVADRVANPLTYPSALAKAVLKQVNPRLAEAIATEGRGSMLLYGARQNPRIRRKIDDYRHGRVGADASLLADAVAADRSRAVRDFGKKAAYVDPDVGGAAVLAMRADDVIPVVRARLEAPGPDGNPLSREAQQAILDDYFDNQLYADATLTPEKREVLQQQQNVTLDQFELAERALAGDAEALSLVEPVMSEFSEKVLQPAAARRLGAEGEMWERPARWDDVPEGAGTSDVVAQREKVRAAESRVDELGRTRERLRRQRANAPDVELPQVDDQLRRVEADRLAAQQEARSESQLLEAYQQRVGRGQEQTGSALEVMVERDVADPVNAVRAGRMDEDVAGQLLSLRQEAIDKGWGEPTLYGFTDDLPSQNVVQGEWSGAEFKQMVDEQVAERMALDPDQSRQQVRNEVVRDAVSDVGAVEVHVGNRPGDFVEVTPSQIRWNQLDDEARVRVRGEVAAPPELSDRVRWQSQWSETVGKHAARPDNLPPQLRAKHRWVEKAVEDFTALGEQYAAEGWDDLAAWAFEQAEKAPDTLSEASARAEQVRGGVLQTPSDGTLRRQGSARLGAEREKRGVAAPNSLPGQLRLELRAITDAARNEVARGLFKDFGVQPGDVLPDGTVASEQWLADNGYQKMSTTDPGIRLDGDNKFVDTEVWMPAKMIERFKTTGGEIFSGPGRKGARAWDKGMSVWKTGVLPVNPRWNIGNTLSNMFMAWIGEGVTPFDMARNWREASEIVGSPLGARYSDSWWQRNVRRQPPGMVGADPNTMGDPKLARLQSSNVDEILVDTAAGTRLSGLDTRKRSAPRRAAAAGVDAMWKWNDYVDRMTHVQIYLKLQHDRARTLRELDQQLARGEITPDQRDRRVAAAEAMTDDQAVKEALRVAGDFKNMSAVEKSIVRRAMPFYSWYKHITKLTLSLPFKSPARTAWTLHLGEMFQDDETRPEWLQEAFGIGGGRYISTSLLNPFAGVGPDDNPLLNPGSALGASTPYVQIPMQAMNYDTRQGGFLSWAPGYGPRNESGSPSRGFVGLPVLGRQLLGQNTLTRTALQTIEDPVPRYDSGQPILSRGRPVESNRVGGRLAPAMGLLGLTMYDVDVEAKNRDAEKRRRERAKERRKYDQERRSAGV